MKNLLTVQASYRRVTDAHTVTRACERVLSTRLLRTMSVLLALLGSLPFTPNAEAQAATGNHQPIEAFVGKSFYHGVPYNQAKLYSDEDVPVLEEVLNDRSKEDAWITAVGTLGAIGTEQAKKALFRFLLRDPGAELSMPGYLAKSNVPVALGWLVNKSGDQEALELLVDATDGDWWANETGINWSTPIHGDREGLISSLVTKGVAGLMLTGTEQARIRLDQLRRRLDPDATVADLTQDELRVLSTFGPEALSRIVSVSPATREAVLQSGGKEFLEWQLKELRTVRAAGLNNYYASR